MTRLLRYLSLFIWLGGAAALYGVYATKGLPHMIWRYEFRANGDRYNPYAYRYYTSCTFWGPYGMFTREAENGRCGWVQLFNERSDQ
ncbi:hypothetical protein [Sulfitobacter geojensis]|uniref:hypothetical protein n=1 Tax=Sulfitobacter geojensis TaxID=1342299 RepID=UPI0036DE1EE5